MTLPPDVLAAAAKSAADAPELTPEQADKLRALLASTDRTAAGSPPEPGSRPRKAA